ncbi:hypothetical protein [Erwinia phage Pecta]|nr:hypothetical protein [Erwinia phage Pecta]
MLSPRMMFKCVKAMCGLQAAYYHIKGVTRDVH